MCENIENLLFFFFFFGRKRIFIRREGRSTIEDETSGPTKKKKHKVTKLNPKWINYVTTLRPFQQYKVRSTLPQRGGKTME